MFKRRTAYLSFSVGIIATLLSLTALAPSRARAAAGDLDPTFGTQGKTTTPFFYPVNAQGEVVTTQPDGKVIVAGMSGYNATGLVRYNLDGTLDTTFGTAGRARGYYRQLNVTSSWYDEVHDVIVQPDGKILVGGSSISNTDYPMDFSLLRFNADGTLDNTFGTNGAVTIDLGYGVGDRLGDLALLPDGKILAGGFSDSYFALVKFNSDGSLDTSFDGDGKVLTGWGSGLIAKGYSLDVQARDNKIVVGGTVYTSSFDNYTQSFALARYNPDGSLDTSFDGDGKVTTGWSDNTVGTINSVLVQSDGKIVAAGTAKGLTDSDYALARYNSDGSPDTDFGVQGKVATDLGTSRELISKIKQQQDGKLVAAGYADHPGRDFTVLRYETNGSPDLTFDIDGHTTTDFDGGTDSANGLALHDGKLIVAGYTYKVVQTSSGSTVDMSYAVARYNANGSLDSGFDVDGKTTTKFLMSNGEAMSVAVQTDGKVVVTGHTVAGFSVVRYTPSGGLDSTFGEGGVASVAVGTNGKSHALAIQPDGKIVVVGTALDSNNYSSFALLRLNSNGSPDNSFGSGGIVITSWGSYDGILDLALQPDGKIVVGGTNSYGSSGGGGFLVARYNSDGSPDNSFGTAGRVSTYVGPGSGLKSIALQADGKIVAVGQGTGYGYAGNEPVFAILRFHPNGTPDEGFGSNGQVFTPFLNSPTEARDVLVQPDQKLVVVGYTYGPNRVNYALARYNSNGSLDGSFGTNGKVVTDLEGYDEFAYTSVLQPNGRIVVGGTHLVRYHSNGTLDASFGNAGVTPSPFILPVNGLAIQSDGKLLAAGASPLNGGQEFGVARFDNYIDMSTATNTAISTATTAVASTATATAGPSHTVGATSTVVRQTATPTSVPSSAQFQDVSTDSPFYAYISCMANRNVISGYPCGGAGEPCGTTNKPYFRPNNSMTRGQVSKIVANAAGYSNTPTGQTFQDVPPDSPFYAFIERMSTRNIISGYECGRPGEECVAPNNRPYFRPNANVSRGQLTKIVSNARGYSEAPAGQTFEDVTITNAFYSFVERLVSRGVMSGYPCGGPGEPCQAGNRGYFRPGMDVTRGQASKIVGNAFFPNCQPVSP